MFDDYNLAYFAAERQKACEQRAARERMLKGIRAAKPSLQCVLCKNVAKFLILVGEKLKALAQNMPRDDEFAALNFRQLHQLLDGGSNPDGIFI